MLYLALASVLVVYGVSAQDCSSAQGTKQVFGQYLQCIKAGLDSNYAGFENEIKEHSRRAAQACFAASIDDGNRRDRCVLSVSDLNQLAWDRHGPLRDCTICRTFAAGAIKAMMNTPAEDQKCIRSEITKAIAREAGHCLSRKISNFAGIPEIPDLEEGSFNYKDAVINSISDHILIHARLSFCAERKPSRALSTEQCLKNPFVGYLSQHCSLLSQCDSRLGRGTCGQRIGDTRRAVCECITESRDDLKQRISGISGVFANVIQGGGRGGLSFGSSSKVDQCVSSVKKHMITPVNDWVSVIDAALTTCIRQRPAGQNLGMEAMLNVGCRKVIADTTGSAGTQLKTGFDFVNNLIDAMVERSGRFCGGNHCFQG